MTHVPEPDSSERSNSAVFFDAMTTRTKWFDGWNDSYEWQRAGLPKTWMNYTSAGLGFFGLVVVPLAIAAVILGHLGLRAHSRGEASLRAGGVIGLVLGYASIGVWSTLLLYAMVSASGIM